MHSNRDSLVMYIFLYEIINSKLKHFLKLKENWTKENKFWVTKDPKEAYGIKA